jgi:hypothetical protein
MPVAGGALRLGKGAIKGIAKGSKTLVRLNGKLALLRDFRFDVYTFLQHKMPDETKHEKEFLYHENDYNAEFHLTNEKHL